MRNLKDDMKQLARATGIQLIARKLAQWVEEFIDGL